MDEQDKKALEFNDIESPLPCLDDEANSLLKEGRISDAQEKREQGLSDKLKAFIAALSALLLVGAGGVFVNDFSKIIVTVVEFYVGETFVSYFVECSDFEGGDLYAYIFDGNTCLYEQKLSAGENSGSCGTLASEHGYVFEIRLNGADGHLYFSKDFVTAYL